MIKLKLKKEIKNNRRKTNLIMEMQFYYDNKIVKFYLRYSFFYVVGMLVGHTMHNVSFPT
jgi:hypothetical protein